MEPISRVEVLQYELGDSRKMEVSQPVLGQQETSMSSKAKAKALVFRDVEGASQRLSQFNMFCLNNKTTLNKLVRSLFTASSKDR